MRKRNELDIYLLTSGRTIKLRGLIYEISDQAFGLVWKMKAQYLTERGQVSDWRGLHSCPVQLQQNGGMLVKAWAICSSARQPLHQQLCKGWNGLSVFEVRIFLNTRFLLLSVLGACSSNLVQNMQEKNETEAKAFFRVSCIWVVPMCGVLVSLNCYLLV